MQALIIGSTGATGQALLPLLADTPQVAQIHSFGRRAPVFVHGKLHSHIIDFARPQTWAESVRGDTVFACLGTTLQDAGGKEAQWQIDYEANLAFARAARQNGAQTLVLVSAFGADAHSRFFYPRMKGALEAALDELGFPHLVIFRPPLLIRPGSTRVSERLFVHCANFITAVGLFKSQRPLHVAELAEAMRRTALNPPAERVRVYQPEDIRALLK